MDATILHQLKFEIDRIYINSIRLAKNNQRITKALASLEKHINEDIAYSDLVSNLKELMRPTSSEIIEPLSHIQTNLDYLLRLHGEAVIAGEEKMQQVPLLNINDITTPQHSFLELKPLLNALNGVGKNKLDIILKAREQRMFDDFRTYPYLNRALANKEIGIVELVESIIKEDLKDKIFPFLLNSFELDDRDDNLRRLTLLYELQYEELDDLFKEILKGNAIVLQTKVIQYISTDVAYEDQIIELSESTQKLIKEKAFMGLVNLSTEKTERKLYEHFAWAIKKKNKGDIELSAKSLSQMELQYTFSEVLGQVKELFTHLLAANKKIEIDHFIVLRLGITALKQRGRSETDNFYLDILLNESYNEIINKKKDVLAKSAKIISFAIIEAIQDLDAAQLIAFYKKVIDNMIESEWKLPFYQMYLSACVQRGDSDEQIYEVFAPYYLKKYIGVEDLAILCGIDESGKAYSTIDPRWANLLYAALEQVDEEENINVLMQVLNTLETDSERFEEELIKAGKKTKKYLLEITSILMERDMKDKHEVVYSLIKHCHDQGHSSSNALRQLSRATYWDEFPNTYAAKFKDLKNAPKAIYTKITDK